MAQTAFPQWISAAEQLGVFRYVLPFLLVFIVVYGILERASPFGGDQQRIHTVLAAVIALFVTAFTPAAPTIANFFSNFFGALAVVLVGILGALIVAGFIFGEEMENTRWTQTLMGLGFLAVVTIFLGWGGLGIIVPSDLGPVLPAFSGGQLLGIAVVVGTIVFLYWALGEEASGEGGGQ